MKTELIREIEKYLLAQDSRSYPKTSFWPSESETNVFDIYHRFKGTPPTNRPSPESLMIMKTGKMVEEAYANFLFKMGVGTDQQRRVEMKRERILITGYIDQVIKEDRQEIPLEIKSYYGPYQEKELAAGSPRPAYLKQLAMYIDFMGAPYGYLILINRGSGKVYQFSVVRTGEENSKIYKCLDTEFNLSDTYHRWSRLYYQNITKSIEPKSEYRYKVPIEEIDWSTISKTDISKARMNKKVIGDFQASYSPYLNLLLDREGSTKGYTQEELTRIREFTKGYSKKK